MRIRSVAISFVVASLALATGALADHKPGHNPGQGNADVTISATSPIVWGRSTAITGSVRGAAAGVLVDLQSDPFPYSDAEFAKEATVPTDAKGDYRFAPAPRVNTRYRAVAQTSPPVTSAITTVLVRIRVKVAVSDSTPKRGSLVRFSGTACPQHDGNTVYVQRRTSTGGYSTVARTTLRDAGDVCSRYARRVRVNSDGVYRVKVSAGGDGDHVAGVSRSVRLDAHR
ncbi:MAG: hypothetical protein M3340_11855 [Actinomycetota bacterium]|nr:hypothetical protein [Actinomycetota bacterium]